MGVKIDELDPYGSVDQTKADDDLFEISKNSGTPGFPIYLPGDSRKITRKELISLLGGIPYSGGRYEVVKVLSADSVQNGINFTTTYAKAKAKAISTSEKIVVYVWVGSYDIQETIEIHPLVPIIGIGNPGDVQFDSNYSQSAIFSIVSNDEYFISNITISNNGNPSGFSISHDTGIIDNGNWDNLIIKSKTGITDWAGNYRNMNCDADLILAGNLLSNSIVYNCHFKNKSCGFSDTDFVSIEGIIEDCTGIDYCFGASISKGVSTGSELAIKNTKGRDYCFGFAGQTSDAGYYNNHIQGIIKNCEGRDYCFGSTTNGDNGSIVLDDIGIIEDCKARNYSCFYSSVDSQFINGKIINFIFSGIDCLSGTSLIGHLIDCKGSNIRGTQLGIIDNCRLINQSGITRDVIIIGDGAIIKYSSIIQLETTKDSIKIASGSSVKITHCELNKDFNLISGDSYTNLIAIPYNIIDSNLTE